MVRFSEFVTVMSRRLSIALLIATTLSAIAQTPAQSPATKTGSVHGAVVIVDSTGPSYIPGAQVVLTGQTRLEAQTDAEGKYEFAQVPAGTYSIAAQIPSLEAKPASVVVEPGATAELTLEVHPSEVVSSVEVTATADPVEPTASSAATISEKTVRNAPNQNERAENLLALVPGVVRGPDGRINMKGARNTQSGALVNSANVTDPATGSAAMDLPIDVVSSVQVISNPYDPQYGKLTGAVSTIDTKTGNYEKLHFSVQNIAPRMRVRDGSILGIGAATPRMTLTGPLLKKRIAFTQSVEYRYIRTPINSLPASHRDSTLEGVNSYTQFDLNLTPQQTATVSVAVYPQKMKFLGLNTFTPQDSTPNYHQRGYQTYAQHRYAARNGSLLTSQVSYKTFDADITGNGSGAYQLFDDTTAGRFFNQQARRSTRFDLQETYQVAPKQFFGVHQFKAGLSYAYSDYDGNQSFQPVEIMSGSGAMIERVTFTDANWAHIHQHETSWFAGDQWTPTLRLAVDLGVRFDSDTVTSSVHAAPRGGMRLALTADGKTVLKAGAGIFYDRVPLMIAGFESLAGRTITSFNRAAAITGSTQFTNRIAGDLQNPRSTAWNVALSRQLFQQLTVEAGVENRITSHDFVVGPAFTGNTSNILLSNQGNQSYREYRVVGRYAVHGSVINASYVRSRAYGSLNDFFQFYGNVPKAIIQPNAEGRLGYDAPNRFLTWGEIKAPWKLMITPVYDIHTGFPYSVQQESRQYLGPRNSQRFPQFQSFDVQVLRPFSVPLGERRLKARAGISVFNLFNHFNPREVQNIAASPNFGGFYNDAWREYRGKLVFEF